MSRSEVGPSSLSFEGLLPDSKPVGEKVIKLMSFLFDVGITLSIINVK